MTLEEKVDKIIHSVDGIEKNSISKLTLAIIGTILGCISSVAVTFFNHYMIAPTLTQETLVRERIQLRQEGLDRIRMVKVSFEKICLFKLTKNTRNEMTEALEELQRLIEKIEMHEVPDKVLESLTTYNDFVALSYHKINSSGIATTEKARLVEDSQPTYEIALKAINDLIE